MSSDDRLRQAARSGDRPTLARERARAGLCPGCGGQRTHPTMGAAIEVRQTPGSATYVASSLLSTYPGPLFTPGVHDTRDGWCVDATPPPTRIPSVVFVTDPCGRIAGLEPAELPTTDDEWEALRDRHAALWGDDTPLAPDGSSR